MRSFSIIAVLASILLGFYYSPGTFEWWPRTLVGKEASPQLFLPTTDCAQWLNRSGETILYRYGANDTQSGACALKECLQREEAVPLRERVKQIQVSFPYTVPMDDVSQTFVDVVELLSNVRVIWLPDTNLSWRLQQLLFEKLPQHNISQLLAIRHGVKRGRLDSFVECSSDKLALHMRYGTGREDGLPHLYKTLVACDNVRSLDLSFAQGGCTISDDDAREFPWKRGDKFPDLTELTVSGYDWDSAKYGFFSGRVTSIDRWKAAMDWDKLKRLDIDQPSIRFLEAFNGQLRGLEALDIRPAWGFWGDEEVLCPVREDRHERRQNYSSFITSLPPLRDLGIGGMGRLLDMSPILEVHGPSLLALRLHEFERGCSHTTADPNWTRPTLSIAQLEQIKQSAPRIESLSVDVHRDGFQWPTDTLRALAAFPKLENLTIYFTLEDPRRTRPARRCYANDEVADTLCKVNELMEPRLNLSSALELFRDMRLSTPESRLQRVTFIAGDFYRQVGGGLRISDHSDRNLPRRYECYVDHQNGERCKVRAEFDLEHQDQVDEIETEGRVKDGGKETEPGLRFQILDVW